MNGIFLCVFALFAVPSVLAISCYKCVPQPPEEMCINPKNVTNCDNEMQIFGPYDACVESRVVAVMGQMKFTLNTMLCGVKSLCAKMNETMCNATAHSLNDTGMTIQKCDLDCCQTEKCNDGGEKPTSEKPTSDHEKPTNGTSEPTSEQPTSGNPTGEGSSIVPSFTIAFTSVVVLLSGFFIR